MSLPPSCLNDHSSSGLLVSSPSPFSSPSKVLEVCFFLCASVAPDFPADKVPVSYSASPGPVTCCLLPLVFHVLSSGPLHMPFPLPEYRSSYHPHLRPPSHTAFLGVSKNVALLENLPSSAQAKSGVYQSAFLVAKSTLRASQVERDLCETPLGESTGNPETQAWT